jgi:hypothetical protein
MVSTCVNYLAVVVAGFVYFAIGAVWYAKPVFGKAWMQGIGKTEEQIKAAFSPWKLVWCLIVSFLAAYGIARILSWIPSCTMCSGLMVGLLAGVCFVFATVSMHDVMEGRPRSLTAINALYHIVGFAVMGLIIGAWR